MAGTKRKDLNGLPTENVTHVSIKVSGNDNIMGICEGAFENNSAIQMIAISEGVTSIGKEAFAGCISLDCVRIPSSVAVIHERAFSGCCALKSIQIPSTVMEIGGKAFNLCSRLRSVEFCCATPSTGKERGTGLEYIGVMAFAECDSLETICIPNTVRFLGGGAFQLCSALSNVTMNEGLERIEDKTFDDCESLESITIPCTVTSIGNGAFEGCTNLKDVELNEGLERIENNVFASCISLISVRFPNSLKIIGSKAFNDCSKLSSITLNEGLERIEPHAFAYTGLEQIHIPSTVAKIGKEAFVSCTELTDVEISKGQLDTLDMVFADNPSLTRVVLPPTLKHIGPGAFAHCTSLAELELREGLETIENEAFFGCKSLYSIYVPSTLKSIGGDAFLGCDSLESVDCCGEFNAFIDSTSLSDWWRQGFIDGATMRELTSCVMLMDYNVPKRMCSIKARKWWADIDRMLSALGCVSCEADYCHEIHYKLSYYEHYREVATLLELAVWKTKVMVECEGTSDPTTRSQARGNCGAPVIIPQVLLFLIGGYAPIYNESLYQDDFSM